MPAEASALLRDRVLAASVKLIESEGLAALSLREVARRAGVSHQAPYHHFGDRESILAALVIHGFGALIGRLDLAIAAAKTLEDKVAAVGETYVAFALDRPAHFQVMFRPELVDMGRFPEAAAAGRKAFGKAAAVFAGLPGDPKVMSALLWSTAHGLASLMLDKSLPNRSATGAERRALARDVMRTLAALTTAPKRRTR